ncbi:MAG TPA: DUF47 family protein [Anaeromyxobacteraceae bacterium]|nr:DUF47 family protein [Anaeromyxobacteraceae bacterium]
MSAKPRIVGELGEQALLLPEAVNRALRANDRVKYCFALLQAAEDHALHPGGDAPTLREEREAAGVETRELDGAVLASRAEGAGFQMPHAANLVRMVEDGLEDMLAPLSMEASGAEAAAAAVGLRGRFRTLLRSLPAVEDDLVPAGWVSAVTRDRADGADSLHRLVMEAHRELNQLQQRLACENIAGASVYALADSDRPLVQAFMRGIHRTSALKFDHPGLETTATRSGDTLLLQNDIGTTESHVLVVKVNGLQATVTHSDPHLQRVRFFQALLAPCGLKWAEIRSRQAKWLEEGEGYYLCTGRLEARSPEELERFLEALGSRLVFLIDWNRARKRLRNFVDGPACVDLLRWAADNEVGHRAFLQLGGERLVYEAIEHAATAPVRYGQRLDEILGKEAAVEFLQFVLRATTGALLQGRSERFVRDEIRGELAGRFETFEHGLLGLAAEHAALLTELAAGVHDGLMQAPGHEVAAAAEGARRAASWERRADEIVNRVRSLSHRARGGPFFGRLLAEADDIADNLEESAFLLTLIPRGGGKPSLRDALQGLAALLVTGTREWVKCLESASHVRRGGDREDLQDFLEAVDRVVEVEHETDRAERLVTAAVYRDAEDWREMQLVGAIADTLEQAADSLARSALSLRDHLLGEVMTG